MFTYSLGATLAYLLFLSLWLLVCHKLFLLCNATSTLFSPQQITAQQYFLNTHQPSSLHYSHSETQQEKPRHQSIMHIVSYFCCLVGFLCLPAGVLPAQISGNYTLMLLLVALVASTFLSSLLLHKPQQNLKSTWTQLKNLYLLTLVYIVCSLYARELGTAGNFLSSNWSVATPLWYSAGILGKIGITCAFLTTLILIPPLSSRTFSLLALSQSILWAAIAVTLLVPTTLFLPVASPLLPCVLVHYYFFWCSIALTLYAATKLKALSHWMYAIIGLLLSALCLYLDWQIQHTG